MREEEACGGWENQRGKIKGDIHLFACRSAVEKDECVPLFPLRPLFISLFSFPSSALGLDDNGCQVVFKAVSGEVTHGGEECFKDFIWRLLLVLPNDTERAFQAEWFPSRRTCLHDPIGIQKDQFTRLQGERWPRQQGGGDTMPNSIGVRFICRPQQMNLTPYIVPLYRSEYSPPFHLPFFAFGGGSLKSSNGPNTAATSSASTARMA